MQPKQNDLRPLSDSVESTGFILSLGLCFMISHTSSLRPNFVCVSVKKSITFKLKFVSIVLIVLRRRLYCVASYGQTITNYKIVKIFISQLKFYVL